MSPLDTAGFVLFTSFVGYLSSSLPFKHPHWNIGSLSMFPPPGASIQAAPSCPALSYPWPPLYSDILPHSMALRCRPARVCSLWKRCDILHAHISPVTL